MAFRNIAKRVGQFFRFGAKAEAPSALPVASGKFMEESQAHEQLREAVRELSAGLAKPVSHTLPSDLSLWQTEASRGDVAGMETDKLEALAKAYFQGDISVEDTSDDDRQGNNIRKAIELWQIGVERDALESKYSIAALLRDGHEPFLAKDIERSYKMFLDLAEQHDNAMSHFVLATIYAQREAEASFANMIEEELDGKAFRHFKTAAKLGILPALYNIGNCYSVGRGVAQSDHNAQLYYSAAAEAGDPVAKFTLGTWIVQGRGGLEKDVPRAFDLQCEAGHAGHTGAMFNVGCHLMTGQGCEKDPTAAAEWFERASNEGNIVQASLNLGNMYRQGVGVQRDLKKAASLFAKHSMTNEVARKLLFEVNKELEGTQ